jgi:hypothetical protein
MMDAVHRFEGTVNQVMGDGIMALFGAPLAHEDHAVRACYAALRMQEAVKSYAGGSSPRRRHHDPHPSGAGEVARERLNSDCNVLHAIIASRCRQGLIRTSSVVVRERGAGQCVA